MHVWIVEEWLPFSKKWSPEGRTFETREGARQCGKRRYWNTLTRVRKYERAERNSSGTPKGSE